MCSFADLPSRLAQSTMGLRVYVFGSEAFLWDVLRLARDAGLDEGEVFLSPIGLNRRVQCIHCKAIAQDVAAPEIICATCGLRLLVRDHFSRRHAAFQGVAVHGATRGEARE